MRTVAVIAYDAKWPDLFEQLRSRVWAVVSDIAVAIEHVGSTAVPSLAAKPIIDMTVVLPHESVIPLAIDRLATLGYVHRGDLGIEGREAFHSPARLPPHHLYVCPQGSSGLANHLAIRDYLRVHPEAAAEYGALKKRLADQFPHDIDGYIDGKTGFILEVLRRAGFSASRLDAIERINRKPPAVTVTTADRILGCLRGIATGDAIGKQTETLSQQNVRRWYPEGIRGFEGSPGTIIPRYVGKRYEWQIGETTDDTERTLAVAQAIIADRAVSHASVGLEMLTCRKSVHPSVKSLWEFHQAADPNRTTTVHDGCGAAIRAAPVGIFFKSARLDDIVTGAREASISTHGGPLAIAAAAANAAAVSAAIDGASSGEVLTHAMRAATRAEQVQTGSEVVFAKRVRTTHDYLASLPVLAASEVVPEYFPNTPLTIVPLALGLATVMTSAEEAILLAANIGGDSDSVASIAGGILGAMYPDTVKESWCEVVRAINGHHLDELTAELARLRH